MECSSEPSAWRWGSKGIKPPAPTLGLRAAFRGITHAPSSQASETAPWQRSLLGAEVQSSQWARRCPQLERERRAWLRDWDSGCHISAARPAHTPTLWAGMASGSALLCNITGSVGSYHSYRGVTTAQWLPVKQGWRNGRTVARHWEPPPHPQPSLCKTTIQCDNTCEPPRNQVDMTKGIRPTSVPTGQGGSQEEPGWHVKSSDCPHGAERLRSRQDQGGAAVASGDLTPELPRSEHVGTCSRGYEGLRWPGEQRCPTKRGFQTLDKERFELDIQLTFQTGLTGWASVTENAPDICYYLPKIPQRNGKDVFNRAQQTWE